MPDKTQANMSRLDIVKAMQTAAFSKNWDLFQTFFTDDVYYRVGDVVESKGPLAIANYLRDLPETQLAITGQEVRASWETATEALAEYTMQAVRLSDNQGVVYPCVDIYRFREDKFCDWRVYPIQQTFIAASSSIGFRQPPGSPQTTEAKPPASLRIVQAFQGAIREANWELASSYLTADAVLRVGNGPEVSGPQAILEHLGSVFTQLRPTGAKFVGIWEFQNALVTEMNVQATLMRTSASIEYPCVETHRLAGGKIREWRIYPIVTALLRAESKAQSL